MTKPRPLPVVGPTPPEGVGRRSVLRGLATGVGAGIALPGLASGHPLTEHAHHPARIASARAKAEQAEGDPELLDAYQMKMLDSLGEAIVPGSTAAGCGRFIDSLLAVGERRDARRFLSALGALEAEARRRFSRTWLELTEAEQVEILEAAASGAPGRSREHETSRGEELPRETWTPGTSVAEYLKRQATPPDPPSVTLRDHFDVIKGWVVGAYYSSEPGRSELGEAGPTFADHFPACTHEDGHRG